ncbi:hypothetical protein HYX03_01610 [Candidatus Woesearchaeota archaeon]|nr:hypothetical protein [Candidatus Woesearchaeota archaeon]
MATQQMNVNSLKGKIEAAMSKSGLRVIPSPEMPEGVDIIITGSPAQTVGFENEEPVIYKVIRTAGTSFNGSILGPHPDYQQGNYTRWAVQNIHRELTAEGYKIVLTLPPLAEYRESNS